MAYGDIGRRARNDLDALGTKYRGLYENLGGDYRRDLGRNPWLASLGRETGQYRSSLDELGRRRFGSGDPSFNFRRDQALGALRSNYGARGGALSGAARTGAQRLASNLASTEWAADYNRAKGRLDSGYQATANTLGQRSRNFVDATSGDYQLRQAGLNAQFGAQQAGIAEQARGSYHAANLAAQARENRRARRLGMLGLFGQLGMTAAYPFISNYANSRFGFNDEEPSRVFPQGGQIGLNSQLGAGYDFNDSVFQQGDILYDPYTPRPLGGLRTPRGGYADLNSWTDLGANPMYNHTPWQPQGGGYGQPGPIFNRFQDDTMKLIGYGGGY